MQGKAKVKGEPAALRRHILDQDTASALRVTEDRGGKQGVAHPEEQILGHYWPLGMFATHLHCQEQNDALRDMEDGRRGIPGPLQAQEGCMWHAYPKPQNDPKVCLD